MSWSEKLSIRIARKLVTEKSTFTVGQVSHGIEIFLLYVLTAISILIFSWFLGSMIETILLSFVYFLFRNFTGGVHLRSPHTCFLLGNLLVLSLGFLSKHFPASNLLLIYVLVFGLSGMALLINWHHAPANHTYVTISDDRKRKSKKIVVTLSFIGCLFLFFLVYFGYYSLAISYSWAVLLQAILLHPFAFHLVKHVEHHFYEKGLKGNV
ncbi:MAG: accessory gene regulator ArgB-like protein [Clostridia bacterium]